MAITTINLSSFDGSNGFRLDGQQVMDRADQSVARETSTVTVWLI